MGILIDRAELEVREPLLSLERASRRSGLAIGSGNTRAMHSYATASSKSTTSVHTAPFSDGLLAISMDKSLLLPAVCFVV